MRRFTVLVLSFRKRVRPFEEICARVLVLVGKPSSPETSSATTSAPLLPSANAVLFRGVPAVLSAVPLLLLLLLPEPGPVPLLVVVVEPGSAVCRCGATWMFFWTPRLRKRHQKQLSGRRAVVATASYCTCSAATDSEMKTVAKKNARRTPIFVTDGSGKKYSTIAS